MQNHVLWRIYGKENADRTEDRVVIVFHDSLQATPLGLNLSFVETHLPLSVYLSVIVDARLREAGVPTVRPSPIDAVMVSSAKHTRACRRVLKGLRKEFTVGNGTYLSPCALKEIFIQTGFFVRRAGAPWCPYVSFVMECGGRSIELYVVERIIHVEETPGPCSKAPVEMELDGFARDCEMLALSGNGGPHERVILGVCADGTRDALFVGHFSRETGIRTSTTMCVEELLAELRPPHGSLQFLGKILLGGSAPGMGVTPPALPSPAGRERELYPYLARILSAQAESKGSRTFAHTFRQHLDLGSQLWIVAMTDQHGGKIAIAKRGWMGSGGSYDSAHFVLTGASTVTLELGLEINLELSAKHGCIVSEWNVYSIGSERGFCTCTPIRCSPDNRAILCVDDLTLIVTALVMARGGGSLESKPSCPVCFLYDPRAARGPREVPFLASNFITPWSEDSMIIHPFRELEATVHPALACCWVSKFVPCCALWDSVAEACVVVSLGGRTSASALDLRYELYEGSAFIQNFASLRARLVFPNLCSFVLPNPN